MTFGSHHVAVQLQSGVNDLMLKSDQAFGEWGFTREFIDEQGLPVSFQ